MQSILLQFISLGALFFYAIIFIYIFLEVLKIKNPFKNIFKKYSLQLIYILSFVGAIGSISLTTFFLLEPCELCWYQRAFMFSIPVISLIALIKKDLHAKIYVFYISIIGSLIAIYHSFLQWGILKTEPIICTSTTGDCATPAFLYFGFVTTPVVALSIFLFLILLSYEPKNK